MRINGLNVQRIMKTYGVNEKKLEKASSKSFSEDKLQISESAKDFQVAMNALNKLPEVRREKVDALKAQISAGTYNPSAEDIADKILEGSKFDKLG